MSALGSVGRSGSLLRTKLHGVWLVLWWTSVLHASVSS